MQVLSYLFRVKLLLMCIVCAQDEITTATWNTSEKITIESTGSSSVNDITDLWNDTIIALPTTIEVSASSGNTTLLPSATENSDVSNFITSPPTTLTTSSNGSLATTTIDYESRITAKLSPFQESIVAETSTETSTFNSAILARLSISENRNPTSTVSDSTPTITNNFTTTTTNETSTTTNETSTTECTSTSSDASTTTLEPCPEFENISLVLNSISTTEVNLTIQIESNETICATEIEVVCNNKWHIIDSRNITLKINDTLPHQVQLRNLSECTPYSCVLYKDTDFYLSFNFTTLKEGSENISLVRNSILTTEVNLTVQVVSNKTICLTKIEVVCNSNDSEWWVIQSRNVTLEINDTLPHYVQLRNLSEFTNYSCVLKKDADFYLSFNFTTLEEVPDRPTVLNVSDSNSTSFMINWGPPDKIPTVLVGYEVVIERLHVASEGHVYNNCSDQMIYTFNVNETVTHLFFKEALADFIYSVLVRANSNVGFGEVANITTTTISAAPDSPENITYNVSQIEVGEKNMEMSALITWNIPCNTNGPVTYFYLTFVWTYNDKRTKYSETKVFINENQTTYSYNFFDIWAASEYSVQIILVGSNMTGGVSNFTFSTPDNYPSAPELDWKSISSKHIGFGWNTPTNFPGNITNYHLTIKGMGVNWDPTDYCDVSEAKYSINITTTNESYYSNRVLPGATYNVSFAAKTSRGIGNWTQLELTTNMTTPDPLKISSNLSTNSNPNDYDVNVTIYFIAGCFNGEFRSYIIDYVGTRDGYADDSGTALIGDYSATTYTFNLQPEHEYVVNVTVKNEIATWSNLTTFTSPAGVPSFNTSTISSILITTEDTQTTLKLTRQHFDESQGSLKYLAIILSDKNVTGGEFSQWTDNSQWPTPEGNATIYYQTTPKYWNPFEDGDVKEYVIGTDTSCNDDQYCNRPLQRGKRYYVLLRMFNDNYYRNTMPVSFITDDVSKVGLITGLVMGILFIVIIGFVVFILWRKGCIKWRNPFAKEQQDGGKTEIPINRFVVYCKDLEQNSDLLKTQWTDLEEQSKAVYSEFPNNFAILAENKRKNRYTNILPFDHSRVKLNIDEDDEICSDYINASYIKGFSNKHEYIATQGPLSHTCKDFWKMIIQEGVSIIVMVSRFIENNRDKCYKYFPNNRETMAVSADIEVRCSTQLDFGFYCIRTLQVKKDLRQITVTHMQFLEWPDFGVPSGTESMLQFCHQLKERWTSEGGMAVVHCSAGVGRTGTIIATDILLQALKAGRKIDVFNTVLELRRQRKSMVQTEKQYMYIHQLIRSMIEYPIANEETSKEPIYENWELKNKIVESAL